MKTFFSILSIIIIAAILGQSCANIIPPGGGPKDSLPPILVTSIPKDSATNINTNKIVLTFNEFVELQSVQENVVVSPLPKNTPLIEYKLRTVTVKLRDSLEKNTTYSIDFGNAIKDINEGNVLKNFIYSFSTGNTLANGTVNGKVVLAETGTIDSTLIVALYNNLSDTAVYTLKPRYIAKLNGKGLFAFNNIAAGKYNAFVLENDYSKRYDDSTKIFAFLDSLMVIDSNKSTASLQLYAYQERKKESKQVASAKSNAPKDDKRLRYTTNLENGMHDLLNKTLRIDFNRKLRWIDTANIILYDTSFKKLPNQLVQADTNGKSINITYNWKENTAFKLLIPKDAVIDSNYVNLTKADTLKFTTKSQSEYGSVKLRFLNIDTTKKPVLLILQNDQLVEAVPLKQRDWIRKLYKPGEYQIKILFDSNGNGSWDAGNYKKRIQPEIVLEKNWKLQIRANWDNETDITW